MIHRKFSQNVLRVADLKSYYYIINVIRLSRAICAFSASYERVLFMGSSKGGFGALKLAGECARHRPDRAWRALAFSPQTLLDESNRSLTYPSFRMLLRRAAVIGSVSKLLARHGDLRFIRRMCNLHATVVMPITHLVDARESRRLSAPNIRLYPLHFALHNTMLPFVMKGKPLAEIITRIEAIYRTPDPDVAATRPENIATVAQSMVEACWLPTLQQLIDEVIAAPVAGTRSAAREPSPIDLGIISHDFGINTDIRQDFPSEVF